MLTLTENATMIVKEIASQSGGGEGAGLRISPAPEQGGFGISPAEHAEDGDQVVEQGGATVYLESQVAEVLDDKILDAGVDQSGNVQFGLAEQA